MPFPQKANLGRAWEQRLNFWHHAYQRQRLAVVMQTTPPTVVHKGDGGSVRRVGTAPCDFAGVALGLPVLFDAKDTKAQRWALSNLKPHQALQLETWRACNGLAFIALQIRERPYVVDWAALGPLWWSWHRGRQRAARGSASIDRAWLEAEAWRMPGDGWLGWVREQRAARGLGAYVAGESRWIR